jgi:FMN reductase (NADPH)
MASHGLQPRYPRTPTIELAHRHYSVRDYKSDPVPVEMVKSIVAAAQRTSTSSNLQTYSIVAVADEEKRRRLSELCGNQKQIVQAPVFLAWCADLSRLSRVCQMRGYEQVTDHVESFLVAAVDAVIAAQTAALAAESLGLGICYIGSIRNHPREVIELLALPHLVFPVTGLTLGWPASRPFLRPRLSLEAMLHWERYDPQADAEALVDYDQAMIDTGIYKGRQVAVPGVEGEMEDYGWLEHSARRASLGLRSHLRAVLRDQGFGLE